MNGFAKFQKQNQDYQIPPYVNYICKEMKVQYQAINKEQKRQQCNDSIIIFIQFLGDNILSNETLLMKEYDSIASLKQQISTNFVYNLNLQLITLWYSNKRLLDNETLDQSGLQNNSRVQCILHIVGEFKAKFSNFIQIFFEDYLSRDTISILIKSEDLIDDLIDKIELISGQSQSSFNLTFKNESLMKGKTIAQYGITDLSVIQEIVLCKVSQNKQNNQFIMVEREEGQIYQINIDINKETIYSLSTKIHQVTGIPVQEQKLFYNGNPLKIGFSVFNFDIKYGVTINLQTIKPCQQQIQQQQVNNPNSLQLYVNSIRNQKLLELDKELTVKQLKQFLAELENQDPKNILCCYNGTILTEQFDQLKIEIVQPQSLIILIDKSDYLERMILFQQLENLQIKGIQELLTSLNFLHNLIELNEFVTQYLAQINKRQDIIFQKCPIQNTLAIAIYTTNLLHQQLNKDLADNSYNKWTPYLKAILIGLRYCPYYRGIAFIGVRNYRNSIYYQKGTKIKWNQMSSFSKCKNIAHQMSIPEGTVFKVSLTSAKDISKISMYPEEQEVILLPFACFKVKKWVKQLTYLTVELKEIAIPRTTFVILWVDDYRENHYELISEIELEYSHISILYLTSSKDAFNLIDQCKWIRLLGNINLRIVTNMVRIENGFQNKYAGIELIEYLINKLEFKNEIMIYCKDIVGAKQLCSQRGIQGNYRITNQFQELQQFLKFQ